MPNRQVLARYRPIYLLCAPALIVTALYLWSEAKGLYTADSYLVGRDFVNYWTGPVAWLKGRVLDIFTIASYRDIQTGLFGEELPWHNWSYPPSMLLLLLPLAALPYLFAYAVWAAGGLALYLWAAMRQPFSWQQGVFFALAPASLVNIYFGQNGFVTGALFLGALKLMERYPVASGVLFGLLTVKPQLGVLIPVALLAARQWRVIGAACISAALLAGASALVFGPQAWTLYITETSRIQMQVLNELEGSYKMMLTPFTGMRLMGFGQTASYIVHMLFALPAAAAVAWAWARPGSEELRAALLLTCTFLATPYGFNYDLTAITGAIWLMACYLVQASKPQTRHTLLVIVLALPAFCMGTGDFAIPIGPPLLAALALYIVREIVAERTAQNAPATPAMSHA